jgi:hypothetical protein
MFLSLSNSNECVLLPAVLVTSYEISLFYSYYGLQEVLRVALSFLNETLIITIIRFLATANFLLNSS